MQKRTLTFLLYHSLPYSLEIESLTKPGARLGPSKSQWSYHFCLTQHWGYRCVCVCTPTSGFSFSSMLRYQLKSSSCTIAGIPTEPSL